MCIFGYGETQHKGTPTEKNHLFPDLVGNVAIVPIHAFDLPFELFAHRRTLVCRVYHDDDALCPIAVSFFIDILDISASEASAFTLDCTSARIRIYRKTYQF